MSAAPLAAAHPPPPPPPPPSPPDVVLPAVPMVVLANATAAAALTMPAPQVEVVHVEFAGNTVTVDCKMLRTWSGASWPLTDNISDTTPLTSAAEMLVP